MTPMPQPRDGRQVTLDGGVQVITSPDRSMTTITDNGRVTTITVSPTGAITATVNGKPVALQPGAVSYAIERVASAASRQPPRVIREGVVRVNGRPLSQKELIAGSAMAGGAASFVALVTLYAVGRLLRRLVRRRPAPAPASVAPNVAPRMDRLEQAVEAIAVEMERVAESQRFSARLLAERLPAPSPDAPAVGARPAPERAFTPH